jgi:hypothetical protein
MPDAWYLRPERETSERREKREERREKREERREKREERKRDLRPET